MDLHAYSIRDKKGEMFSPPFYQATHGLAERAFTKAATDPQSNVNQYPGDFDLYHIGTFNDQTGKFSPLDSPVHQLSALQVHNKTND